MFSPMDLGVHKNWWSSSNNPVMFGPKKISLALSHSRGMCLHLAEVTDNLVIMNLVHKNKADHQGTVCTTSPFFCLLQ